MLIYSGKDDLNFLPSCWGPGDYVPDEEVSENRTLYPQVPFAYGLTDDPYSRSLGAWEDGE